MPGTPGMVAPATCNFDPVKAHKYQISGEEKSECLSKTRSAPLDSDIAGVITQALLPQIGNGCCTVLPRNDWAMFSEICLHASALHLVSCRAPSGAASLMSVSRRAKSKGRGAEVESSFGGTYLSSLGAALSGLGFVVLVSGLGVVLVGFARAVALRKDGGFVAGEVAGFVDEEVDGFVVGEVAVLFAFAAAVGFDGAEFSDGFVEVVDFPLGFAAFEVVLFADVVFPDDAASGDDGMTVAPIEPNI